MTLKNNRAPLLSNIKLYASFHHHLWIQTAVTVREHLSWVVTSVTLWLWHLTLTFAWNSPWSLVITPENFITIRWLEHSEKGGTSFSMNKPTTWCKSGRVNLVSSSCLYKTQPERALAQVCHTRTDGQTLLIGSFYDYDIQIALCLAYGYSEKSSHIFHIFFY